MSFSGRLVRKPVALLLTIIGASCHSDSWTAPDSSEGALRLEAVSATELDGTVGQAVSPVPSVIVRNESGQPVAGVQVTFRPMYRSDSANGDFVAASAPLTNSRGIASPKTWTLGTLAGPHGLEASIVNPGLSHTDLAKGRVVAFHLEGHAATAVALSISKGQDQVGLPGDEIDPPTVRFTDRFGNVGGGVTVTFAVSGGGSLAVTQAEPHGGIASGGKWTLGSEPGLNTVVATAPGFTPVIFNAKAVDVGKVAWYDLMPLGQQITVTGSIGLSEGGTFEYVTVETSAFFPEPYRVRELGTYKQTGTTIVLTYSDDFIEQGALVDDTLSLVRTMINWVGKPTLEWRFVRRQ